ncbi:kunitz-type serine protease inhibitor bitisilin-3-like [Amblyomma americanum]
MKTAVRVVIAAVYGSLVASAAVKPTLGHDQFTCADPPEYGPCNETSTRFYYDTDNRTCREFIYGGCEGIPNNYETLEECRVSCELRPRPICYLPKKRGPCNKDFPRFFYNAESQTCEQFFYGGCMGNANNFRNIQDCQRICSP